MLIPAIALRAYVVSVLWGWFFVRLGLPPITVAWAAGVIILVDAIRPPQARKSEDKDAPFKSLFVALSRSVFISLVCLLIGWIALQWMPAA
jgi:Kef-type K+ transport system membrane component KefB